MEINEKFLARIRVVGGVILEWLGISLVVFAALSVSKIDIIASLGFDSLFGAGIKITGPAGISFVGTAPGAKIVANLLASAAIAISLLVLRGRTQRVMAGALEAIAISEPKIEPNHATSREVKHSSRQDAILSLNKRIANLTLRATTIYWTIIFSLVTGVFLIIFAGYLSSFDTNFSNLSSKIESDRQGALEAFGRYFVQRQSPGLQFSATDNNAFDYAWNRIKVLDESYSDLLKAMIHQTTEKSENKPVWNWPSTILRIGVIGLLVFLTQILISLYRYNSRLIAFYGSRRDALILAPQDFEEFDKLANLMFPASLDFGKEPRHPFLEVSELFRRTPRTVSDPSEKPHAAREGPRNSPTRKRKQQAQQT